MLNDRDEKHEGHEESEYHFSDDEVSYEVETESPKAAAPGEPKENVFNRLTRSKRMLISLGVFLVLVFVVYKMVSPTSTPAPGTDITAAPTVAQQSAMPKTLTPPAPPKAVAPAAPPAAAPAATVAAAQPVAPDVQAIQSPVMQVPAAPATTMAPPVSQPAAAMPSAMPSTVTPTNTAVVATMPAQPAAVPTAAPTALAQPAMPQQPVAQAITAPAPTPPAALPSASPTTAALPATPAATTTVTSVQSSTSTPTVPSSTAIGAQVPGTVETKITNVASANDKMLDQLEAEYSQKLNDYMTQNKALQDQVQTLNSRVASMETQMNQLIQALTHQGGANNASAPSQPPPVAAVEVKAAYNVQAIIPGRAWLRADNGETVTVAEGDMIKDLGRVTKIDPYDGVVEINTGNKVISLSYGSGG